MASELRSGVEVLSGIVEYRIIRHQYGIGAYLQHTNQLFEVRRVEVFPNCLVHEKEPRLAVVHEVMDIIGLEFMQNRHRDSTES